MSKASEVLEGFQFDITNNEEAAEALQNASDDLRELRGASSKNIIRGLKEIKSTVDDLIKYYMRAK